VMTAKTTPIDDLLRQVPIDAIASYEHSPTAHSNYPYGRMCHEAADTIAALRREVEGLEAINQDKSNRIMALTNVFEHNHRGFGSDTCAQCGLDIRDPIHKRWAKPK